MLCFLSTHAYFMLQVEPVSNTVYVIYQNLGGLKT
jgi:hypothetical protein